MFRCLAFVRSPKEKREKPDYRPTPSILIAYRISTKQCIVCDPLAKTLHHSTDVASREGTRFTTLNAADQVIFNRHFYRDGIVEPTHTRKQSETSQPIENQRTVVGNPRSHTEEPLGNKLPLKPMMKLRDSAGLETSPGDAGKPPGASSRQNRAGRIHWQS